VVRPGLSSRSASPHAGKLIWFHERAKPAGAASGSRDFGQICGDSRRVRVWLPCGASRDGCSVGRCAAAGREAGHSAHFREGANRAILARFAETEGIVGEKLLSQKLNPHNVLLPQVDRRICRMNPPEPSLPQKRARPSPSRRVKARRPRRNAPPAERAERVPKDARDLREGRHLTGRRAQRRFVAYYPFTLIWSRPEAKPLPARHRGQDWHGARKHRTPDRI
jgi:hypothetical protein